MIVRIFKKIRIVLDGAQLRRAFLLMVLMIMGAFLETISVSLMLPFMELVMNPNSINSGGIWDAIHVLHGTSIKEKMALLAVLMAAVYIIKNTFLVLQYNIRYRFIYRNQFIMQHKLLKGFIYLPYEEFLNVNSGEMVRILNVDVPYTFALIFSVMTLISESIVSVALSVTIFIVSPIITMVVLIVLAMILMLIARVVKPIAKKAGSTNQRNLAILNMWLLQSIQGIKELKAMRKELFFVEQFDSSGEKTMKSAKTNSVLSDTPRFIIEAVIMAILYSFIAFAIMLGAEIKGVVPALTAMAMAGIRLIPATNRMSSAISDISFKEVHMDKVIEQFERISEYSKTNKSADANDKRNETRIIGFEDRIELKDISFQYHGGSPFILHKADMLIHKGESIGIVGESGAGKTTLVDIMLGLLHVQSGNILVDGKSIYQDMEGWLSQIGYVPQNVFMLDGSIRDNVAFGLRNDKVDDERIWSALREASIDEFVRTLPEGIDTKMGERGTRLSGGQKQRLGIARALYLNPPILVFDEATSALDNRTEEEIIDAINKLHGTKTVIVIAHRLSTIKACDHVYCVQDSKIIKQR